LLALPVAKKKGAAHRGVARHAARDNAVPISMPRVMTIFRLVLIAFKKFSNLFMFHPFLK
jgi:hypothetical protein